MHSTGLDFYGYYNGYMVNNIGKNKEGYKEE